MRSCIYAHVCVCLHVRVSVRVGTIVHAGLWAQRLMLQREKSSFTGNDSGNHSILPLTLFVYSLPLPSGARTRANGYVRTVACVMELLEELCIAPIHTFAPKTMIRTWRCTLYLQ